MSTNGADGHPHNGSVRPPVDRALELLVYRPVGLTVTAWLTMPKLVGALVSRGCAQLGEAEARVRQARLIGEVAVNLGPRLVRRQVDQRLAEARRRAGELVSYLPGVGDGRPAPPPSAPSPAPSAPSPAPPPPPPATPATRAATRAATRPATRASTRKRAAAPAPPRRAAAVPAAADLPIPAYDGLSASQVVSRLRGLTPAELSAVSAYERAGRARKTVLVAIDRLLAS